MKVPNLPRWVLVSAAGAIIVLIALFLFRESNSWPVASRGTVSIETTFTTFDAEHLPLLSRNDIALLASTSAWGSPGQIALGSRQTGKIFIFRDSEVGWRGESKKLTLDQIWQEHENDISETFILDIASFQGEFFVSSIGVEHAAKSEDPCAFIGVDRLLQNLKASPSVSRVWTSPFCLPLSGKESPGWHDLHGRLVVEDQTIFMATGALLNETYEGTFPNRGLRNLPNSRESADARFGFFGRLISIDRETGGFTSLAQGFRGPSGLGLDSKGEYFLIADHGPRGGDELNMVDRRPGSIAVGQVAHYGWPLVSLGASYSAPTGDYSEKIETAFDEHSDFIPPIYSWVPGIAPSQVMQVPKNGQDTLGRNFREGDWIVSSLKAESIFHLRLAESGTSVLYSEKIEIGSRIRDMALYQDGFIVSTDDGQIIKIHQADSPVTGVGAFPPVQPGSPIYDSEFVKYLRSLANTFLDWVTLKG